MDGPKDLPKKIEIGKHIYKPRKEKGVREGMYPRPGDKKAIGLISHSTAMNLMIQSPGDGMVPGQCLGKISYLLEGAPSEQGAYTVFPQGKMPHLLQQVK